MASVVHIKGLLHCGIVTKHHIGFAYLTPRGVIIIPLGVCDFQLGCLIEMWCVLASYIQCGVLDRNVGCFIFNVGCFSKSKKQL